MAQLLGLLPAKHREILVLRVVVGLTAEEPLMPSVPLQQLREQHNNTWHWNGFGVSCRSGGCGSGWTVSGALLSTRRQIAAG